MESWALACKGCGHVFKHSETEETLENRFLPAKPQLPLEGNTSECPNCKAEFSYQTFNLRILSH
jgi:rubredoxin